MELSAYSSCNRGPIHGFRGWSLVVVSGLRWWLENGVYGFYSHHIVSFPLRSPSLFLTVFIASSYYLSVYHSWFLSLLLLFILFPFRFVFESQRTFLCMFFPSLCCLLSSFLPLFLSPEMSAFALNLIFCVLCTLDGSKSSIFFMGMASLLIVCFWA